MRNWKIFAVFFAGILMAGILAGGCREASAPAKADQPRPLKIGYVDMDKLLLDYPEYKKFNETKQKENININQIFARKNMSEKDKEYVKQKTLEFMESEKKIIEKFLSYLKEGAIQVSKEKKYDLVILNPSFEPTLEYGGDDITEDVRSKMKEMEKSNKQESK